MNVRDEHSVSLWMDRVPVLQAPRLTGNERADVIVVGSGIAGLSTAYELARQGKSVIVIDRGGIGSGMTTRTTAHLASELDDYYHKLIEVHGEDQARRFHESQVAAINRIEAICRDEAIDCEFRRLNGYLFQGRRQPASILDDELDAVRAVIPLPIPPRSITITDLPCRASS